MQRTEKQREKTSTTEEEGGVEAGGEIDLDHADGLAPGIDTGTGHGPETGHMTEEGPGQDRGLTEVDPTAGRDPNFLETEKNTSLSFLHKNNPCFQCTLEYNS